MEWVFEGIGTALVIALLGGGGAWYWRSKRINQKQKARDNATQVQSGRDTKIDGEI